MVSKLANFLNNPPRYAGVTGTIALLGVLIGIIFIVLIMFMNNKTISSWSIVLNCLGFLAGAMMILFSSNISYRLEKTNLQTKLSSEMKSIDNEYPYQLSIIDNNKNVYFVFCKTKNSQNNVIKTMNTGNNPIIEYSNQVATYTTLPHQIDNEIQTKKKIEEKDLLFIVKNSFVEF